MMLDCRQPRVNFKAVTGAGLISQAHNPPERANVRAAVTQYVYDGDGKGGAGDEVRQK